MGLPFADPVTLHGREVTGQDQYGDDIYADQDCNVRGVFVPGGSVELIQGQATVITRPRVFLPAGTDVTAVDAVTVRGRRYDVDGTPSDWRSPMTGWRPGIEVPLREVTG